MKRFTWQMNPYGYPTTQLGGYGFQYHKIILCSPPGYEIDHITRVKADCRYFNLRVVSHKENMWNYGARDNTKSNLRGVYQKKNKWMAFIVTKDGQKLDQACNSREEALALRKYWEGIYHVMEPIETPHLILPDGTLNPNFRFDWYPDKYYVIWNALSLTVLSLPLTDPAKKPIHI